MVLRFVRVELRYNKKFRSNRSESQPSCIIVVFCNHMEHGEQNKFYKSGDLFCLLFTLLAAIFSSCRFTNEPNRGISRGVSRIVGFSGKCFLFSCNHPLRFFISFAHHIYIVILVLQQIGVNRLLRFPSMIGGLLEFKVSSQRFETDVSYLWLLLGVLTQLEEI